MITLIYDIQQENDLVTVKAVVEDMILIHPATRYDPEEYGPALCEATFNLDENELLPKDDDQLIDYLEGLDLEWTIVPKDEYDFKNED